MKSIFLLLCSLFASLPLASQVVSVFDMAQAKELCDSYPLSPIEGIWLYPEDKVTVLVMKEKQDDGFSLPSYTVSVIDSSDCRLRPGQVFGTISETSEPETFILKLFTEFKANKFLKPESCTAKLSKDGETLDIKKEKSSKFRFRFNFNPSRLLPSFWRIVNFGVSSGDLKSKSSNPIGMVKIYPSYDGNGSSRRKPRYL